MPTVEHLPVEQVLEEVAKYLWGGISLNLSKRQIIGGRSKYHGLLLGRVSCDLMDDDLKTFTAEEISIGLKIENFIKLKLAPVNCVDVKVGGAVRNSTIKRGTVVQVSTSKYGRFVVCPSARMLDNYSVCSWEPMLEGLIRVHSLRHFRELLVEEY